MRNLLPLCAVVLVCAACKKEPAPEPAPPAQTEAVPISNDPRNGAAMIKAAERVAGQASDAGAAREAEAAGGR